MIHHGIILIFLETENIILKLKYNYSHVHFFMTLLFRTQLNIKVYHNRVFDAKKEIFENFVHINIHVYFDNINFKKSRHLHIP